MQKAILLAVALMVVVGATMLLWKTAQAPADMGTPITLTVGTTTVVAEVVQNDADRARGLGGRTSLEEGKGMWFVFEQDGYQGFWMKDTLIALDILWVAADGTIVTIAHSVAPESFPQVYRPKAPARYVLEVPAGFSQKHGVAEDDKIVVE